jgi:DNA-binding Lrp family transcriptional regulator
MKDIREKLIKLLKHGYCTPQIARIARKLGEPATTIHYNIKRMEKDGITKACKVVFDYKKIDEGYCTFVLVNISPEEYENPERIAHQLVRYPQIESIDIITGDWEMILKIRTKDISEYYEFVKKALSIKGIMKIKSLSSLRQVKTEFIQV